ncbi:receptor-like protein kinase 5 [Triticum urartu]|uniref:receptor-like protein kinase 5 n=1 Tax=Triticum urartu TaxID=4572 RepID=UPI002043F23D|nr:receptor-like protein kinase 5 [Triticum urartu]
MAPLLLVLLLLVHRAAAADERQLLIQIKRAWSDPPVLAAWSTSGSGDHCAWPYVTCDTSSGRVTSLSLANINITAPFPDAIGGLYGLTSLNLSNNNITGAFPTSVYRCASLRHLDLRNLAIYANNLTGEVVDDGPFGAVNLVKMDLSENHRLSGPIPEAFGHLPKLERLSLFLNHFSGEIPASISRLPSLVTLQLFGNCLNGTLPRDLGKKSPELVYVEVDDNEITGAIPEGLCTNGMLQSLTARNNRLNGSIPEALAGCSTLKRLILRDNKLTGKVPFFF